MNPSKIIGIHLNYPSRLAEFGVTAAALEVPSYFLKPPTAIARDEDDIVCPADCSLLNYEGEVGVVIGRRARRVALDDAMGYVAGYCAANDFSIHDFRGADRGSMLRVKGQDGFCPVSDMVDASEVDPRALRVSTHVDSELVQEGSTAELVFPIAYLIADLSRHITLEPGDLILSGTPANSRPVAPGAVVAVEVEGVGRVANRVVHDATLLASVGAQPDSDAPRARDIAFATSLARELQ